MKEPVILANWMMCPDGTMIPSFHRHDYRTHTTIDTYKEVPRDLDGAAVLEPLDTRWSMNDGGSDYIRRGGVFTDMTVYDSDSFEVIRRFVCRGGRGKDGTEPLTWIPLFRMSNLWIESVLQYNKDNGIESKYDKWFQKELDYRFENKIFIKDKSKI